MTVKEQATHTLELTRSTASSPTHAMSGNLSTAEDRRKLPENTHSVR